jgi:signal transduction histidine kinase
VFDDASLFAAYRTESEHLNADRLPLAVALCLGLLALAGVFEVIISPDNLQWYLLVYCLEALAFAPILLGRRELLRRGWLQGYTIAAWCLVAVLAHGYSVAAGRPPELIALSAVCLVTGTSLLLPWGLRGQTAMVASTTLACAIALALRPAAVVPAAYLFFIIGAAAAISLFGAYHFDLHRFALFCEATRREDEAALSRSLVAIAKEINASLDADDVLDRIAAVTRSALHASWSVIVQHDPARNSFLVVGSAGPAPEEIMRLRGVEFGPGAFPLLDRVVAEQELALFDHAADAPTGALMQRWQTRSLFAAALLRHRAVAGVLLTGTQTPAERLREGGRELFAGIAQQVAIALGNVRLVADLRRANELKSEFLSTMSHELRTPLNVIIGYTDLMRDEAFGALGGDQQDVLTRVRTSAHSLLELINATLEVNRLEAGRSGVHLHEVELRQLLTELQIETEQLPRPSGVMLRWEVPRSNELVRTDPLKLKIVVRNLIGNALKFTKRGYVTVQVGFDQRSKMLELVVRDTGPGIDAETLPKVFDMFHQGPGDNSRGGVGLGLYIVKRFVEMLGGRIAATSRLGEGSSFRVSLPAGVAAQPASFEEHRLRRSA